MQSPAASITEMSTDLHNVILFVLDCVSRGVELIAIINLLIPRGAQLLARWKCCCEILLRSQPDDFVGRAMISEVKLLRSGQFYRRVTALRSSPYFISSSYSLLVVIGLSQSTACTLWIQVRSGFWLIYTLLTRPFGFYFELSFFSIMLHSLSPGKTVSGRKGSSCIFRCHMADG